MVGRVPGRAGYEFELDLAGGSRFEGLLAGDQNDIILADRTQAGFDVLEAISFPWPVAGIARQHQGRLDGSGYRGGLTRGKTPAGQGAVG